MRVFILLFIAYYFLRRLIIHTIIPDNIISAGTTNIITKIIRYRRW